MLKYLAIFSRIILGLAFLIFGLNGFLTFIPVPEFHPFMEILVNSGYMQLVKLIEVVAGLCLLFNYFVPLALVLLGAILVNIAAYHFFLDPRNIQIVPILTVLYLIVLVDYGKNLKVLWQKKSPSRWSS